ncbi:uncharacterized protein C8Q71DRAFT_860985 [Rhodofomes roseus]|uniref:Uncharacterized protein n=1 Tax=Rhodofomes roseus TaxID=34475 RepID=A0ABQ8K749_9APHY|nr:uncharacterized protein C8Q71DRAFT_860985 [Rhodofomes roseus]KAH9832602.1 hypothetical protein C8Q71DRAFT_860985 [Rhodofomes roseus]
MSDNSRTDTVTASSMAPTTFPPAFLIGPNTITNPLVGLDYVKGHLRLLGAFATSLSKRVQLCPEEDLPQLARGLDSIPEAPRRWAWFVYLAVERFRLWVNCVTANKDIEAWVTMEIPPLDVLMVWHAYMLNPTYVCGMQKTVYAYLRSEYSLHALNDRLIRAVIVMGDPAQYQPSEKRGLTWLEQTGTPFDPIEALKQMSHHEVVCPRCGATNAAHLAKDHNDPDAKLDTYFPGTLRSPTDVILTKRARAIKERIVSYGKVRRPKGYTPQQWRSKIKEDFSYSISELRDVARPAAASMGVMKRMIFSAYTDDSPFSIDLVGAVIRQCTFTNKMHAFGWTAPGYFDTPGDGVVLIHAITRYHAFLDLMTGSPASFFVPTLDIDLVWHTHQLMAGRYSDDCKRYVGRYIDYDDKVEENRIANAFDITCQAWQQHFKVPYTHCGCPLPGDTIGDRLQCLTRKFMSNKVSRPPASPTATHASEHNAAGLWSFKASPAEGLAPAEDELPP